MDQTSCTHCSSNSITRNVKVKQSTDVGTVGLAYKRAGIFHVSEQLLADLCTECGTIVRLYVSETDRNWVTVKQTD